MKKLQEWVQEFENNKKEDTLERTSKTLKEWIEYENTTGVDFKSLSEFIEYKEHQNFLNTDKLGI